MRVLKEILLHKIIPYISYFDLDEFLDNLGISSTEITAIKSKEYTRRLKCIENPRFDILKEYRLDGVLHRDDGPAKIYANGSQIWFRNNKRHRDDGPAVICVDGCRHWYKNGVLIGKP